MCNPVDKLIQRQSLVGDRRHSMRKNRRVDKDVTCGTGGMIISAMIVSGMIIGRMIVGGMIAGGTIVGAMILLLET